ncbi:MAG: hypothetical protein ABIP94_13425 [Planctomycetota bacterium]
MHYQHARVVLAACLAAATSAAQAPATITGTSLREVPSTLRIGDELGTQNLPAARLPAVHSRTETSGVGSLRPETLREGANWLQQDPRDQVDYSLRAVFADAHGEFMSRRERYDPQIEFRARLIPEIGINHEPGSFDLLDYNFDGEVPAIVSPDGYLLFGAYYDARHYDFSRSFGTKGNGLSTFPNLANETLIAAGLRFGFGVFLDENVLLEVETNPGVWTDADATLTHKDFDFPSHALLTFRAMPNLFFKIGARYNQVYKDAPWLPMLGISWEIAEGIRFDLLAPERVEFSFWPSTSTGIMIGGEVVGGQYRVRTSEATGNLRGDVRVQEALAYVGIVHRLTDFFSFTGRGGLVLAGDYDLTNGAPETGAGALNFNRVEGSLDTGWFAEIMFGIDF